MTCSTTHFAQDKGAAARQRVTKEKAQGLDSGSVSRRVAQAFVSRFLLVFASKATRL
jgi:hypothetical protein